MPLCCVVQENIYLDDSPTFLVFSIFYLEVGVGVAISLNFDPFSFLLDF